jgi:hypothetical protein
MIGGRDFGGRWIPVFAGMTGSCANPLVIPAKAGIHRRTDSVTAPEHQHGR